MKAACLQMDMLFAQPEENFAKAKRLIRDAMASEPDVVVLPETWNTGFFPKQGLSELADRDCARVKRELGVLAAELGVNLVAGSVANVRGGKVYNTACVFDRAGNCVAEYDKTHLFTPMGEHEYFTPGDHLCRFRLDGHDCGLVICYDIRFPELARTLAVQGMDMLFVVSQWPAARIPHLRALTVARAIENQMFVVCCNSCGDAGETRYGGFSAILDPWGQTLALVQHRRQTPPGTRLRVRGERVAQCATKAVFSIFGLPVKGETPLASLAEKQKAPISAAAEIGVLISDRRQQFS